MSIVTSAGNTRIVFCEGEESGPDVIFWGSILMAKSPASFKILLQPIGGKQAAKRFAGGYARAQNNQNWRIVRDRDLDKESPSGAVVFMDEPKKVILTGCTCLESYFLLPELLAQFIEDHQEDHKLKTSSPSDHEATLGEALEQLRDYQAVRWALQALRRKVQEASKEARLFRTEGQFDLPNRLKEKDGKLPVALDLASCQNEAEHMIKGFRDGFHRVDLAQLHDRIEHYRATFEGDDFWREGFRFWFHGKDVLTKWLQSYPQIGVEKYRKWVVHNLDWRQFPDLVEIQSLCHSA